MQVSMCRSVCTSYTYTHKAVSISAWPCNSPFQKHPWTSKTGRQACSQHLAQVWQQRNLCNMVVSDLQPVERFCKHVWVCMFYHLRLQPGRSSDGYGAEHNAAVWPQACKTWRREAQRRPRRQGQARRWPRVWRLPWLWARSCRKIRTKSKLAQKGMGEKNKIAICPYATLPDYPLPQNTTTTKKKCILTRTYFHTLPPALWSNTHVPAYSCRVCVWDPTLVHSSSAVRCGGTWDLDPVNFFLRDFFSLNFFLLGTGPCGLVPPLP